MPSGHPVEYLCLSGKLGAQVRATVHSFGPLLLGKVLTTSSSPGGDPSRFGLRAGSGFALMLDDTGDLVAASAIGALKIHRPIAYQQFDGRRVSVASAFVVTDARDVRFQVGAYDRSRRW